ncbi:carbohydrate kinase family protein [bacterium]|nr:carbohydrate kinase family protein [bacterium]
MGLEFDVVVIGNVGIDTNVYLPGREVDFSVESNFSENLDCIGQAGGYTAMGFARLGYKTAFIGYVGNDFSGKYIREEFSALGINCEGLFIDPQGTSRSVNHMSSNGSRKNFYDGKSHMNLEPNLATCHSILSRARFGHFHLPNWARKLLPIAKNLGLTISVDLQDIISLDDDYRHNFISHCDVLFASMVNQESPNTFFEQVTNRYGEKRIIMGLGSKGCAYGDARGIGFYPPFELQSPVIDTNGAGDGLAVGFVSALIDDSSIEDGLIRGQICPRHNCTLRGDSTNLLDKNSLLQYVEYFGA